MNPLDRALLKVNDMLTTKHTGKMEGMQSLSTSCLCNHICKQRALDPASICYYCYASTQLRRQRNTASKMERNEALKYTLLTDREVPVLNCKLFRFESFGDLETTTQAANYLKIASLNPDTLFSLFTKNPQFIQLALDNGSTLPDNLSIVVSSPYVNQVANYGRRYSFVTHIFTVWTSKEAAMEQGYTINCGDRRCLSCGRCYHKGTNGIVYINELLKGRKFKGTES